MSPEIPNAETGTSAGIPGKEYDYSLEEVDNELIAEYRPQFIARGGEHLVYEIPDHPDSIVKVRISELKKLLQHNYQAGEPLDSVSPEIKEKAESLLETERNRYKKMRGHFGREHVPNQKEYLVKVPITEDIIRSFYDGQLPVNPDEVWSIAMIQQRIEELDTPHLSLVSGYAEHAEELSESYEPATEYLLQGKSAGEAFSTETFLDTQGNQALNDLLEKSANDESLRGTLQDLTGKIISYSNETGEILDLAGEDNIILHEENGEWSYTLVDARYPGTSNMIDAVKMILLKNESGDELDENERNMLLNTVNFARTINGLADGLGINERINIIPEELRESNIDFQSLVK